MEPYDQGYEDGVKEWAKKLRDLPRGERRLEILNSFTSCVRAWVISREYPITDFATGFTQALVDKESQMALNHDKEPCWFSVSAYANAMADMVIGFQGGKK